MKWSAVLHSEMSRSLRTSVLLGAMLAAALVAAPGAAAVKKRRVGNFEHQLLDVYKKLVEFAAKEQ